MEQRNELRHSQGPFILHARLLQKLTKSDVRDDFDNFVHELMPCRINDSFFNQLQTI